MATASLTKMTVPLASDQSSPTQGMLMPKLVYRFRVSFIGFGVSTPTTELTKQVMDCTKPNVGFDDITLDIYNSKIKLAGKPNWEDLTITIRDDASGAVSQLVGEQLQKQFDFAEQSSAASGIDYKFVTQIQVLDGGNGNNPPSILEEWDLYGCYLKTVNYNEMNYATSDAMKITLNLRYDNAVQNAPGSGVGAPIIRTIGTVATA